MADEEEGIAGGGRFRLIRKIGAGGMGDVYEARDDVLKRTVALKKLPPELSDDPDRRRRLLREARSAARITDPGVAALYDVVEEHDDVFLVMEYVDGTPLSHLRDKLTRPRILDIARQLADALASAHDRGIVHGDIKPDNVMMTPEGRVKILDFGVAGLTADAYEEMTTAADTYAVDTDPGTVGMTPAYASPEALRGDDVDPRSDLFSLGIVLYELLAGRHPFAADTWIKTVSKIIGDEPVRLREIDETIPADLERVVLRLLAKEPEDRYPSAEALEEDLDAIVLEAGAAGSGPWEFDPRTSGETRPRRPESLTRRIGLAVAAALAIAGLAYTGTWLLPGVVPDSGDGTRQVSSLTAETFDASDWIIAVLPSTSAEEASQDVAVLNRGLATTLTSQLTQLSRTHALQVVPSSTLRELQLEGPQEVHRELGVTLVLDLHTQVIEDRVRVNANLVNVRRQRQLAADTIDGAMDNLLALQEDVGERVTRMLRLELGPAEREKIESGTSRPRAYAAYVRGRGYLQDYTDPDNVEAAVELFERALEVDPDFAAAHAGLGLALWRRYELGRDPDVVDRALAECEEAIALDVTDAGGHVCRGTLLYGTGRYEDAVTAFQRAVDLEPTRDEAYRGLADAYLALGRTELAEATYEEAIALRPHYWAGYNRLAALYYVLGRYEKSVEQFRQVVRIAPDSYRGYSNLGAAAFWAGRWDDAHRAFETALEIQPGDSQALSNLGTLEFYEGDYDAAARRFEAAVEGPGASYQTWGNLADVYHWGQQSPARAEEAYRRAIELARESLEVNPNDAVALSALALYEIMVGQTETGIEHAERALELSPDDVSLRVNAARAFCVADRMERCLDLVDRAVADGALRRVIREDPAFRPLHELPAYRKLVEVDD